MELERISETDLDVTVPPPAEERLSPDYLPLDFVFRGFECMWTGWKISVTSLLIAGQWIGVRRMEGHEPVYLCVNLPEMQARRVKISEQLNQWPSDEQCCKTWTVAGRKALIEEGRGLLKIAIDEHLSKKR